MRLKTLSTFIVLVSYIIATVGFLYRAYFIDGVEDIFTCVLIIVVGVFLAMLNEGGFISQEQ